MCVCVLVEESVGAACRFQIVRIKLLLGLTKCSITNVEHSSSSNSSGGGTYVVDLFQLRPASAHQSANLFTFFIIHTYTNVYLTFNLSFECILSVGLSAIFFFRLLLFTPHLHSIQNDTSLVYAYVCVFSIEEKIKRPYQQTTKTHFVCTIRFFFSSSLSVFISKWFISTKW